MSEFYINKTSTGYTFIVDGKLRGSFILRTTSSTSTILPPRSRTTKERRGTRGIPNDLGRS